MDRNTAVRYCCFTAEIDKLVVLLQSDLLKALPPTSDPLLTELKVISRLKIQLSKGISMDPALAKEVAALAQHRAINEAISKGDSEIQKFYNGATLFITGASGFMGKQLLEKLFRSCDIKKVYLLLRPKKKRVFYERLDHMLKDPVFDELKKTKPDFAKNIKGVQGDVSEPGLGISKEDKEDITKEVDIIIHGAATVNFDESLKLATLTNVRGTVEALNLGKACKNLRSFVHISTAFSYATKSRFNQDVMEQFYDPPLKPNIMIDLVQSIESARLEDITQNLIDDWPNTYTFTKAIAEEAVREASAEIPVSIIRPAIVISSNREPTPGWLDSSCAYGPSGFLLGGGLGIMHALLSAPDIKIDVVPVDLVNNAIIAAGWATNKRRLENDKKPKIYTVTSLRNYVYWHVLTGLFNNTVLPNYTTPKAVWYTFVVETQSKLYYKLLTILWHYIPALFIDLFYIVCGKPPVYVDLYQKVDKLNKVLSYFTCNEWRSNDQNLQHLFATMNSKDQLIYNFDVSTIDWKEQTILWAIGIRKYLIKDGLQDTEYAIKKQNWLKIVHYIASVFYIFAIYKLISIIFNLGIVAYDCILGYF